MSDHQRILGLGVAVLALLLVGTGAAIRFSPDTGNGSRLALPSSPAVTSDTLEAAAPPSASVATEVSSTTLTRPLEVPPVPAPSSSSASAAELPATIPPAASEATAAAVPPERSLASSPSSPPSPASEPSESEPASPPPMLAAGVSAAPTAPADVTVNVAVTPDPDADVTIGGNQVLGDASRPEGTGASLNGTLLPTGTGLAAPASAAPALPLGG